MHEFELVLRFLRLKQSLEKENKILYEQGPGSTCHVCHLIGDDFRFQRITIDTLCPERVKIIRYSDHLAADVLPPVIGYFRITGVIVEHVVFIGDNDRQRWDPRFINKVFRALLRMQFD